MDDSHTKALGDPTSRPSERQKRHDALLEERRKAFQGIEQRISEIEAKSEETRIKLDAAGGRLVLVRASGGGDEGGDGWASYLDEQSGRYYWFNDHTGEAYYDDDNFSWNADVSNR